MTLGYMNLKRYRDPLETIERFVEFLPEDSFMRKLFRQTNGLPTSQCSADFPASGDSDQSSSSASSD